MGHLTRECGEETEGRRSFGMARRLTVAAIGCHPQWETAMLPALILCLLLTYS